jgi:O-antigen ligase
MWVDHPFSGVGLFQGDKLLPEYYEKLGIHHTFYSHAHNVPLQWAAGAGSFAILLYLFIVGTFLRWTWDLRKSTVWGWSLLMSQIYFHIGSLTEANFFDGEVNHVLVVVWALVAFLHSKGDRHLLA